MIESLKVLLAVHLDLQLCSDVLVNDPGPLEVLARWGRPVSTIEELLRELTVESGQAAREGGAESRNVGDRRGQGWGGQKVVNERSGAGLGSILHPVCAVHGSGFIQRGHDRPEQLRIDDRNAKVRDEFLFEDFREPYGELRLQSAEVER